MSDPYPLEKARLEVDSCIRIWRTILEEHFGDRIVYAYVKGSTTKRWDSPIDYVPVLSDVDIHFKLKDDRPLFCEGAAQLSEALAISAEYEERFLGENPAPLHIPRAQVMVLNRHLSDPDFILPSCIPEQNVLMGRIGPWPAKRPDEVRAADLRNLSRVQEVLAPIPGRVMDRVGIDLVTLIRSLCYEVSPAPVRLLSQLEEDPYRVWELNRTAVCGELKRRGFTDLAERYSGYYLTGWDVFRSGFHDGNAMRKLVNEAYSVLELSAHYACEKR
jgi:hypothetical protein